MAEVQGRQRQFVAKCCENGVFRHHSGMEQETGQNRAKRGGQNLSARSYSFRCLWKSLHVATHMAAGSFAEEALAHRAVGKPFDRQREGGGHPRAH